MIKLNNYYMSDKHYSFFQIFKILKNSASNGKTYCIFPNGAIDYDRIQLGYFSEFPLFVKDDGTVLIQWNNSKKYKNIFCKLIVHAYKSKKLDSEDNAEWIIRSLKDAAKRGEILYYITDNLVNPNSLEKVQDEIKDLKIRYVQNINNQINYYEFYGWVEEEFDYFDEYKKRFDKYRTVDRIFKQKEVIKND